MPGQKLPLERVGRYRVVGRLGSGGMGTVYRARDETLERDVALKVLESTGGDGDDERRQRFLREARALAALSHPNVAAVLDVGQEAGTAYLVMELVEGASLRAELRQGRIAPRKVLPYARDVARGLAAAHARGIVHRDIKPDNVVVDDDGRAKIVDFGLAKSVTTSADAASTEPGAAGSALTVDGAILGTPQYMAPEQARGAPIDARADVFSYGALVYELVHGKPAFAASSVIEALVAVQTEDPPLLREVAPGVPDALAVLVHACLDRDASRRPENGQALVRALEGIDWPGASDESAGADLALAATMASSESLEKLRASGRPTPLTPVTRSDPGAPVRPDVSRPSVRPVDSVATPLSSGAPRTSPRPSRLPFVLGAVAVFGVGLVYVPGWLHLHPPEAEAAPAAAPLATPAAPRITPLDAMPIPGAGRVSLLRDGTGVAVADRGTLRVVGWDGVVRASLPVATEYAVVGETSSGAFLVTIDSALTLVRSGMALEPLEETVRRARLAPDGNTIAIEDGAVLAIGGYDDPSSRAVLYRTALPILFSWSPDSSRLLVGELHVTGTRRDVSIFVAGADGTRGPVLREGTDLAGPFGPSLGWLDDGTILFARHIEGGAEIVALGVDDAGRAVGEERIVLPRWTIGFPTELAAVAGHLALVATHETRTLLEASVLPDGTLATPRALVEAEDPLQPIGMLVDGTRVVASFGHGWSLTTLADDDGREPLATIPGDLLAASVAGDAIVFLRPAGDRHWEAVRRTNAGESVIVTSDAIAECDAPLLDCTGTLCVVATASGTELELRAFDATTGATVGSPCVTAPGAAGSVRAISIEPRASAAVVFSRNGDHRLVRVVLDGCEATEREIAGASIQYVEGAADGSTLATSISHVGAERRIVRIPEGGSEPALLLAENAWLYRPVISPDGTRLMFGRRNDRASAFLVELGGP